MAHVTITLLTVVSARMVLLGVIFAAGLLHGFGPDHLAAITAFGTRGGNDTRRVVFFSTRFALGHAFVIAVAGLLGRFGRFLLPALWEHRAEIVSGWLLVLTGIALAAGLLTGRISLHGHSHHHTGGDHRHFHLHFLMHQNHQHGHGTFAAVLGALFALGGLRGLLAVVPIALAQTLTESLIRITAFVLGIIISMVSYGVVTQRTLTHVSGRSRRWAAVPSYIAALFCIVAGWAVLAGKV